MTTTEKIRLERIFTEVCNHREVELSLVLEDRPGYKKALIKEGKLYLDENLHVNDALFHLLYHIRREEQRIHRERFSDILVESLGYRIQGDEFLGPRGLEKPDLSPEEWIKLEFNFPYEKDARSFAMEILAQSLSAEELEELRKYYYPYSMSLA